MSNTAITNYAPETGLSIFDKGHFENLCNISAHLGRSPLIPASLKGKTDEETAANCLLVVEQSQRWGLSPFAVMQCASVVHGRLMWEGKLVAGVIEAKLGIRLSYTYEGAGLKKSVVVSGQFADEKEPRTISGTVEQWKTTGNGSPWEKESSHERMLAYRGAREWARRHCPSLMLGIVTDDEELPTRELRDVTPIAKVEPVNPFPPRIATVEAKEEAAAPVPAPVTTPASAPQQAPVPKSAPDPIVGLVKSVTCNGEQYLVVMSGKEKDAVLVADTMEIGQKAEQLEGLRATIEFRAEGPKGNKTLFLTAISLFEEEGGELV